MCVCLEREREREREREEEEEEKGGRFAGGIRGEGVGLGQ